MNETFRHPAIDQHIPIFMEVALRWRGVQICVYDLHRQGAPIGIWYVSWKGLLRPLWTMMTMPHSSFTVYAGMSLDDFKASLETGDRPLGYDG